MSSANVRIVNPFFGRAADVLTKGKAVSYDSDDLVVRDFATSGGNRLGVAINSSAVGEQGFIARTGSIVELFNGLGAAETLAPGDPISVLAGGDWGLHTTGQSIDAEAVFAADEFDEFILAEITSPAIGASLGGGFVDATAGGSFTGDVGFGGATPTEAVDATGGIVRADYLSTNETAVLPTAVAGQAIFTADANGVIRVVNGATVPHTLHHDARAELSVHSSTDVTQTITTQLEAEKVTVFDAEGFKDAYGNAVPSIANDEITLNVAGAWFYPWGMSLHTTGGVNRLFACMPMVEPLVLRLITAATNATPIQITTADPFSTVDTGDIVILAGGTGNTAVNGTWFLNKIDDNNFTLFKLDGTTSVGNGTYDANSAGATHFANGGALALSSVSSDDISHVSGQGTNETISVGDKVALHVVNLDGTQPAEIRQAKLSAILRNA